MAKSTTIKIGADTSDFTKALKKVDKEIKSTQKEATYLQNGLKLEFDETRFVQAQKKAQQALAKTEDEAKAIREQLEYLEKTGGVDTQGYEDLQTTLAKTETKALSLKAQLEQLDEIKLENTTKAFTDFGTKTEKLGNSLKAVSVVAAAAVVGMAALAQEAVTAGDDINTMSDQYDLSTTSIQRWNYVALQGDVSSEKLYKSVNKVRDALGSQMRGEVNAQTEALSELEVQMSDFESTDDAFNGTIKALSNVTDSTLQYNLAVDLFGDKVATDMLPLLAAGEEAISSWADEFEQIGYLTEEQVTNAAEFDEAMNIITSQFEQAKLQLGVALIPVLEIFADILKNDIIPLIERLTEWFDNLSPEMKKTVVVVLAMIAALSPLLIVIGKVSQGIAVLIPLISKLKVASWKASLGLGAIVGALALGVDLITNWKDMSTLEKILKSLALAALVAAAAMLVFHASWSLGLAVGAIAAGVVAGVAAINAARAEILPEEDDISVASIGTSAGVDTTDYSSAAQTTGTTGTTETTYDNSTTEINIAFTATGNLDYDVSELADAINKELVNRKLAYQ